MKTNCPAEFVPTLAQLQHFRTTGATPKVDVMKMAGSIIPVHNPHTGKLLGYGRAERVDVSKTAHDYDPNSVFDDSPLLPDFQPFVLEIEKAACLADLLADDENAELVGVFPLWLQPS